MRIHVIGILAISVLLIGLCWRLSGDEQTKTAQPPEWSKKMLEAADKVYEAKWREYESGRLELIEEPCLWAHRKFEAALLSAASAIDRDHACKAFAVEMFTLGRSAQRKNAEVDEAIVAYYQAAGTLLANKASDASRSQ
jgi:hypothetical protein